MKTLFREVKHALKDKIAIHTSEGDSEMKISKRRLKRLVKEERNKLLQEMENELKTFAPKTDDTLKKKLNNIRRQIKRNMNTEKDWHLFKLYFEEVNENFFNILQKRYDSLTTGDQILAALIKLNLNIKEAAAVLNISPDSVKKARYRLRKKVGLNNRENLTDFLAQLDNFNP